MGLKGDGRDEREIHRSRRRIHKKQLITGVAGGQKNYAGLCHLHAPFKTLAKRRVR